MFTGASTAAVVSAYAAMAAAIASTASAVVTGVQAHQAGKVQEAQARFNRDQELEAEKQAHQEESLNATQHASPSRMLKLKKFKFPTPLGNHI